MTDRFRTAFFAFPGMPNDLVATITSGTKFANEQSDRVSIKAWPSMDIFGAALADTVRDEIRNADILVCDVTRPNLNVYYEIGFAIGLKKPIAPVVNSAFADATRDLQKDGFFDSIGYKTYENSNELAKILVELPATALLELYGKGVNHQQPLFVLDTFRKTDFRNAIVSAVKASNVFFRSFDPAEVPRFSTINIISEASASAGIVVPLLAPHVDDAFRHNLRGAFLAGMAHGLSRDTLLIQRDNDPVPADYRNNITSISVEADIHGRVVDFANDALLAAQSVRELPSPSTKSALQKLTLGASAAENEFRTLEQYFVETAEYLRAVRGETRVVAGRKGSGKTAIFFRVRDHFRSRRDSYITDLKPESHQLSLFREELLKSAGTGVFDHTLAAFWYLVLLAEVLLTIRQQYSFKARHDDRALSVTVEIDRALEEFAVFSTGDFTSRLNRLGRIIVEEIKVLKAKGQTLTPERLTPLVFKSGITQIRELIDKYTTPDTPLVLLFDNIDKGWAAQGVHEFDVRLVRLLVETLDKIRRDFSADHRDFMSIVFLRNDIYELLVGQTPDRGKAGQARIDWTDRAQLRQVIYKRLIASTGKTTTSFDQLWNTYFVPSVSGKHSFDYFVDHCLMRPRFLINIIENAVANGINRGHARVEAEDCVAAVKQHSLYLVNDFGYEIRDVSNLPSDILYSLVGITSLLTREEVIDRFRKVNIDETVLGKAFDLMLWYGVVGVVSPNGSEHFIYDYDYDIQRLDAEIRNGGSDILYVANPALHVALVGK